MNKNIRDKNITNHFGFIVTLTLVIAVLVSSPISTRFEFDADEGVILGKASLVEQGYKLYSQVWSDHPPLFTYLLAFSIRFLGNSVYAARLLTVAFAGLLVWTSWKIMETSNNIKMAVISTFILVLTDPFLRISSAVMEGLPAIALANLAIYSLIHWHKRGQNAQIILSAIAISLSIATKLFTAFLIPVLLLGMLISDHKRPIQHTNFASKYKASLLWTTCFTLSTASIFYFLVGFDNLWQLIQPPIEAISVEGFVGAGITFSPVLLSLAVWGGYLIIQEKNWMMMYPLVWMLISYPLLINLSPAWYHQKLLFTVPAAMVATLPIYQIFVRLESALQHKPLPIWVNLRNFLIFTVLAILAMYMFVIVKVRNADSPLMQEAPQSGSLIASTDSEDKILQLVNIYAPKTEWMLTDLPMYAFRAGILMPPNTAVISQKRVLTSNITEQQLIDAINEYEPEQVLLGRFFFPELNAYLGKGYSLVLCEANMARLYVSKELVQATDHQSIC